mgnify:FL=1
MRRTSQTIAMNLRFHLYASTQGAVHNTYPGGPGRPAVPVPYTRAELDSNREGRDRVLIEWAETDPDGFNAWSDAMGAVQDGDDSSLRYGWSSQLLEEEGLKIVDPCAHCRECRSRRTT